MKKHSNILELNIKMSTQKKTYQTTRKHILDTDRDHIKVENFWRLDKIYIYKSYFP